MKITLAEYNQAKNIIKLYREQKGIEWHYPKCDRLGNVYNDEGKTIQKIRFAKNGREQMVACYKGKKFAVASLVANKYCHNPYGYDRVIFKDDDPKNCNADNLVFVSNEIFYLNTKIKHPDKCPMGKGMKPLQEPIEIALQKCKNEKLLQYYKTKDEAILNEIWSDVNSKIHINGWHKVSSECYLYFIDRCQRNSFFGNPIAYFTFVAQKKLKGLKKTLNTSTAKDSRKLDDELIRKW